MVFILFWKLSTGYPPPAEEHNQKNNDATKFFSRLSFVVSARVSPVQPTAARTFAVDGARAAQFRSQFEFFPIQKNAQGRRILRATLGNARLERGAVMEWAMNVETFQFKDGRTVFVGTVKPELHFLKGGKRGEAA